MNIVSLAHNIEAEITQSETGELVVHVATQQLAPLEDALLEQLGHEALFAIKQALLAAGIL